jgi:hypothetical protein
VARGFSNDFVCAKCIDEEVIQSFIGDNAERKVCSFCGKRSNKSIAAPLKDVAEFIERGISGHYEDPANCLGHDSSEGGYQGTTFSTYELLAYEVGLDFPNDDGRLLQALCNAIETELWCETDPYGMSPEQRLSFSWESFCERIKYQRRYFFLGRIPENGVLSDPSEILHQIFSFAEDAGLFVTLPAESTMYRTRYQPIGCRYRSSADLGPPPIDKAVQTNRMSPPGIVMMYASEQRTTALAETADTPGDYAVGCFVTKRNALVLDLTSLPRIPSIFEEIPDSSEYDPRPRRLFLHQIADDISRPIARDDRVHVEYVPTQVVTEYLRTVTNVDNQRIDGIRYRSSRRPSGSSLVLFVDQNHLILPADQRPDLYGSWTDRWVQLKSARAIRVTSQMIDSWK